MIQQYQPGTQENYNSFSSRNPITEKGKESEYRRAGGGKESEYRRAGEGKELEYPEGAGGGKGEPGVPPKRFDFVFSYWIFAWYLLYELRLTKYNPKIALILAAIENLFLLLAMIYFSNSLLHIALFCIVNFFIKIIPLYTLVDSPYRWKDFYAFVVLGIIYLFWLLINRVNMEAGFMKSYNNLKNNKPLGPFMYYVIGGTPGSLNGAKP